VIASIQDTILQNEGVPLREEGASLFQVVSQTTLRGPHSLRQGLNDWLEVIVKGLGFTDVIQSYGCGFGGNA